MLFTRQVGIVFMGASVSARIYISPQLELCSEGEENASTLHVNVSGFVVITEKSLINVLRQFLFFYLMLVE